MQKPRALEDGDAGSRNRLPPSSVFVTRDGREKVPLRGHDEVHDKVRVESGL